MRSLPLLLALLAACCGGSGSDAVDDNQAPGSPPPPSTSFAFLPEADASWELFSETAGAQDTLLLGGFDEEMAFPMADGSTTSLVPARGDTYLGRMNDAGRMAWLLQIRSDDFCYPVGMAKRPDGSVLLALQFRTNAFFPTPGGADLPFVASDGIIVARYSADGTRLAYRRVAHGTRLKIRAFEAWDDGSYALVGTFRGEVTIAPSTAGETTLTAPPTETADREFVARLDASGEILYAKSLTATADSTSNACAAGTDGSLLVCGTHREDVAIGGVALTAPSDAYWGAYLVRLAPDGAIDWVRAITGPESVYPQSLTTMRDGRVLLTVDFWPSMRLPDGSTVAPGLSGRHGCVAAVTADGSIDVLHVYGHANFLSYLRAIELEDGGIAFAGTSRSYLKFEDGALLEGLDAGTLFHFVVRYDAAGNRVWAREDADSSDTRVYGLVEHPAGSIGLSGSYRSSYTVDRGGAHETGTAVAEGNVYRHFYTQFHPDGAFGNR